MTYAKRAFALGLVMFVLLAGACGGDDDDSTPSGTEQATATATGDSSGDQTPAGDSSPETTATSGDGAGEVDVCSLLTQDEVEGFIGVPPDEPTSEGSIPPFFGCTWDSELPTLSVTVIAWENEGQAKDSMEFAIGNNDYPEIDGLGDQAYNSQPIDDVTVRKGRYEVSVGLYFLDEDDKAELDTAIDVAKLVLDRLP